MTVNGCRWAVKLPKIIEDSVTLLSDGGLGMAMFSLGTLKCFAYIR